MPYLFKLTKRLASSRTLAIVAIGIAACTASDRSATDPGSEDSLQVKNSSTAVSSVSLSPSSATGSLGQSAQFTATAHNLSGGTVSGGVATWTSTDSTIVAISPSGMGVAVGVGQATITATINGMRGTAQTTVTGDPIASIAISPATASGTVGQQAQFVAALTDASGTALTGRRVIWTSSNPAVVTVDTTGFATGVGAGSATITATSAGKSASANVTVGGTQTVSAPGTVTDLSVTSIADTTATLSFTQVSDGTGAPASYEVRFMPGASVTWGAATAVPRGTCAPPLAGTAIGAKLSCTVNGLTPSTEYSFELVAFRGTLNVNAVFGPLSNVIDPSTVATRSTGTTQVASVAVSPGSASGAVGQSAQFSATVKDASGNTLAGQTVVWSSTNTAVVTVTSAGYATAVGAGSAAVVATSAGKSGQAAVTVTGTTGTLNSINISPSSASIAVGSTQQLTPSLVSNIGTILTGLTVTWSSNNTAVATVSSSGLVTAVSAGSVSITATSGGVSSSSSISVTSAPIVPSSGGWTNAPSSYPAISDQPFDLLNALGWATSWNTAGNMAIAVDATAPQSPSNVLQFTYPIGMAGGAAPAMEYRDFPLATHFYGGFWWKANANWQGHNSNVNKMAFVYQGADTGDAFICFYGPPGGPYQLEAALEFKSADTRDRLVPNVNNVPIMFGGWHKIEWQMEYNTTTSPANGIMRWWLDGTLIGQYTDILYPTTGMEEFQVSPTWGGMGDVKTQTDHFWFDHVYLKGY
jgi:uncharacterized protein YjdB